MNFTQEKLEYLREITTLSPIINGKLLFLKKQRISQSEIDKIEYTYRFSAYEKRWESTWKKLNWGNSEDESLSAFAASALEQEVNNSKTKKR